jgi:delta24-sterol reductase
MPYIVPFANDLWFRWLFGWLLPPYMALLKGSHTDETREASARKQVYQDVGFPADKLEETLTFCDKTFEIYPLLCYPCKIPDVPGRMVRATPNTSGATAAAACGGEKAGRHSMFLNLGIYGVPKAILEKRPYKTVTSVRALEKHIRSVGGFQHTYCVRSLIELNYIPNPQPTHINGWLSTHLLHKVCNVVKSLKSLKTLNLTLTQNLTLKPTKP